MNLSFGIQPKKLEENELPLPKKTLRLYIQYSIELFTNIYIHIDRIGL